MPIIFYVAAGNSVREYALDHTNTSSLVGSITGSQTALTNAYGMALDANNNIFVANTLGQSSDILEFAAGALGNVAPIANISGNLTQLSAPYDVAVDPSGNVWVANLGGSDVLEFAPGSNGNVAPSTTIGGSNAGFGVPMGIATDSSGNVYVTQGCSNCGPNDFVEFAAGSHGNVAPLNVAPGHNGAAGITVTRSGIVYACVNGVTQYGAPPNGSNQFTVVGNLGISGTIGISTDGLGRIYVAAAGNPFSSVAGGDTAIYPPSLANSAIASLQTSSWGVVVRQ